MLLNLKSFISYAALSVGSASAFFLYAPFVVVQKYTVVLERVILLGNCTSFHNAR